MQTRPFGSSGVNRADSGPSVPKRQVASSRRMQPLTIVRTALFAAALLAAHESRADLADIVNAIRRTGCERQPPAGAPVTTGHAALDSAARLVAGGSSLGTALEQSG